MRLSNIGVNNYIVTLKGAVVKQKYSEFNAKNKDYQKSEFVFAFKDNKSKEIKYINCVAWDKQAQYFDQAVTKGTQVFISGYLKERKWTDKDGKEHIDNYVQLASYDVLKDSKIQKLFKERNKQEIAKMDHEKLAKIDRNLDFKEWRKDKEFSDSKSVIKAYNDACEFQKLSYYAAQKELDKRADGFTKKQVDINVKGV
ncbi:single-stranded DNA-binding protein [Mycoplasma sp. 4423]